MESRKIEETLKCSREMPGFISLLSLVKKRKDGISLSELKEESNLKPNRLLILLACFEKMKLVKKERMSRGQVKIASVYFITPAGEKALEKAIEKSRQSE